MAEGSVKMNDKPTKPKRKRVELGWQTFVVCVAFTVTGALILAHLFVFPDVKGWVGLIIVLYAFVLSGYMFGVPIYYIAVLLRKWEMVLDSQLSDEEG